MDDESKTNFAKIYNKLGNTFMALAEDAKKIERLEAEVNQLKTQLADQKFFEAI